MALVLKNNASSTLAGGISTSSTTISVQSGDASKFPTITSGDWHPLTIVDGAGNIEIVRATARSGAVITVTRAQEGTTAFAFDAGASVQLRPTAGSLLEVLGLKADIITPTFDDKIVVSGNAPVIQMTDEDNAGQGKHYFWELDSDVLSLLRDQNADGDADDGTETTPVMKIDGANGILTIDFDLVANSLKWIENVDAAESDLNALVHSGLYAGDAFTNAPDGSTGSFFLLVQRGTSDNEIAQTAFSRGDEESPRVYTRLRVAGTWGEWFITPTIEVESTLDEEDGANKIRVAAIDNDGVPVPDGIMFDTGTGKSLANTATAEEARTVLGLDTDDAAAFGRVHAGGDATNYNFNTASVECAFLNPNTVRVSCDGAASAQFQRLGSNGTIVNFFRGNDSVGDISVTGSATSFNTSSDYRLKYDVASLVSFSLDSAAFDILPDTLRRIMATRPVSYRWKDIDDATSDATIGFIAHELQAIYPNAVSGEKDAVEAIGDADMGKAGIVGGFTRAEAMSMGAAVWSQTGTRPVHQSVDHSKLVPALAAGMQELTLFMIEQARTIDLLTQRVAALEAGV